MNSYQQYIDDLTRHCTAIDCQERQRMLALKLARDEDIVAEYGALAHQLRALCDDDAGRWSAQPETLELAAGIVRDWSRQMARLTELHDLLQEIRDTPTLAEREGVAAQSAFIRKEMCWAEVPDALAKLGNLLQTEVPPEICEEPAPEPAAQEPVPEATPAQPQDAPDMIKARRDEALARIAELNEVAHPPISEPEPVPTPASIIHHAGETFRDFDAGPELVVLPPGEFWMGSADTERDRASDETRHIVHIGYELAVGKFPVTFDEWDACLADGGTKYKPADQGWGRGPRPVINVSWRDAKEYVDWLNRKIGKDLYRLLSEAEWEYAARAGQGERRYPWGDDQEARLLPDHVWFTGNSGGRPHPVGQKPPNAFGLHDMHGNIQEWVEDVYLGSYDPAPDNGNAQTEGGISRVLRGGSWLDTPRNLRSAARYRFAPDYRGYIAGFRVARVIVPELPRGN